MRQKLDLHRIYARSRARIAAMRIDGLPPRPLPVACPYTLDQLLTHDDVPDMEGLARALRAEPAD